MIRLQFFGNFSLIGRVCIGEHHCSDDVTRLKKILENEKDKEKKKNSAGGSSLPLSQEAVDKGTRVRIATVITYCERNFFGCRDMSSFDLLPE